MVGGGDRVLPCFARKCVPVIFSLPFSDTEHVHLLALSLEVMDGFLSFRRVFYVGVPRGFIQTPQDIKGKSQILARCLARGAEGEAVSPLKNTGEFKSKDHCDVAPSSHS